MRGFNDCKNYEIMLFMQITSSVRAEQCTKFIQITLKLSPTILFSLSADVQESVQGDKSLFLW